MLDLLPFRWSALRGSNPIGRFSPIGDGGGLLAQSLRTQVDFTLTVQRAERMSDAEIAAELEVLQKQFAQWVVERQSLPAPAQSSSAARR